MTTIQVATGRMLDVANLKAWDVEIEDIATALSNLCRFTGHVKSFYSVAQHCVEVSVLATEMLFKVEGKPSSVHDVMLRRFVAKRGLLHDAHEAFIGDIARPMKSKFLLFEDVKRELDQEIFTRFGVLNDGDIMRDVAEQRVREADEVLLATEKRDVLHRGDLEWPGFNVQPMERVIVPVGPEKAKAMFVNRFNELWAEGVV